MPITTIRLKPLLDTQSLFMLHWSNRESNMKHNRYHGRYFTTGDKTALKVIIASVVFNWVILNLNWATLLPAKAEFISPVSDAKLIEVEKIKYVLPETIEDKICAVFKEDCGTAVRVARCESGLNPKAKNKTSSARGLFQIMSSVHQVKETWLYDADVNINIAHKLYLSSGWNPWISSKGCWGN